MLPGDKHFKKLQLEKNNKNHGSAVLGYYLLFHDTIKHFAMHLSFYSNSERQFWVERATLQHISIGIN